MAMAVLNGLPERFNNLISALDALGNENETFSLEFVQSLLLQEEQRINMRLETSSMKTEASALVSARRSRQPRTTSAVTAERTVIHLSDVGKCFRTWHRKAGKPPRRNRPVQRLSQTTLCQTNNGRNGSRLSTI